MTLWNQQRTDSYAGTTAETIAMAGANGDMINAYLARPLGPGPFPGVVLAHHLPGWDEFYREMTRRFADHGYLAICPNLYARTGQGLPDEITATVRAGGGANDDLVVGDLAAAAGLLRAQSFCNGKVGVIGTCSGGRHAYLAACKSDAFNAVVDCWGGGVVMADADLTPNQPVSPVTLTNNLKIPLLGLFGNDDQRPSAEQVNVHEEELKKQGKNYEFHRYDGAGHGFFYYHTPLHRPESAQDAWNKIFAFFDKNLG